MNNQYLVINDVAVQCVFQNEALQQLAKQRLYLQSKPNTTKHNAEIVFTRDDEVDSLIKKHIAENAVYIEKNHEHEKIMRWQIKVFNQFCVEIVIESQTRITVRYGKKAILSYLLDDVLQGALQGVLAAQNGFILHGACLVKQGKAVAIIGDSGSGKSTTAYNLIRGGYHCYADDAVIVTCHDGTLKVWPFSKEVSIRPLSYNLLREQGIEYNDYRQDGKKYYFKQTELEGNQAQAILTHVCLIQVAGKASTTHYAIDKEELKKRLQKNNKFFSFINRDNHDQYGETLVKHLAHAVVTELGFDLKKQIYAFDDLLHVARKELPEYSVNIQTREQKLAWLKAAWNHESEADIKSIVPLLADSDLRVFETTLAFLQNMPLAQVNLINWQEEIGVLQENACDVLRLKQWMQACQILLEKSSTEMLAQYAVGWLTSAPILYGCLYRISEGQKKILLDNAWQQAQRNLKNIVALRNVKHYTTRKAALENIYAQKSTQKNHAKAGGDIIVNLNNDKTQAVEEIIEIIQNAATIQSRVFVNVTYAQLCALSHDTLQMILQHNPYALSLCQNDANE